MVKNMLDENVPIFNLRAVVQETGIKPDTLRAWERRYGLPIPKRTEGGHRLFSRRDIDTVKWLLEQRKAGLGISKAVDLWKKLELDTDGGRDSDAQHLQAPAAANGLSNLDELRKTWVAACKDFDERSANLVLTEAFSLFPVERVCFDILAQGIADIGQEWYDGNSTVQQEHFATSLATRQLDSLLAAVPAPTRSGRILAACPPQENHSFSLLMLSVLLRRAGWDVVYLGANVPINQITETIDKSHIDLVVSSAQLLHTAATLRDMGLVLQSEGIPLAYGGRIFNLLPDLRDKIPGAFLGQSIEGITQIVERLMIARPSSVAVPDVSSQYEKAMIYFRQQLPVINAAIEESLQDSGISLEQLSQANSAMAWDIAAALSLGSMDYLNEEIAWIEGLLHNQGFPAELLDRYLITYNEVLQTHLDSHGKLIQEWLSEALRFPVE